MSTFPRIDPNHPLTEAARATNAYAEEHGTPETLDWLGMDVGVGEIAYLSEQRALRAIAAHAIGLNMGLDRDFDEHAAHEIMRTPLWQDMRTLLIACYMDGITIGWKAHQIAERRRQLEPRSG